PRRFGVVLHGGPMKLRFVVVCLGSLLWSVGASAQPRYDVGLLLGWTGTGDEGSVLRFDSGRTFQATFAWRVWRNPSVGVAVEVPFIASPAFDVTTPGSFLPKEYASLYLTPGVRVTIRPDKTLSVFGSAGAGYARYSESKLRVDGGPNPAQRDTNTNAF